MIQDLKKSPSKVSALSNLMMLLTSIHHVYGAAIYQTPFRLHILFISIPVLLLTIFLNKKLKGQDPARAWFVLYALVVLICSILLIGVYEGVYNHIVKNIAFFGGLSQAKMDFFFPPPVYELPNDFFFELTGILQGILAICLAIQFIRLLRRVSFR